MRKHTQAFSLIEVLLAILIMAAATSLILKTIGGIRGQANKTVARDHVRKVQEAYDAWLADQPSVEYARSVFNPDAYADDGATSIAASYPDPNEIEGHLSMYLSDDFMADFTKEGSDPGRYKTRALEDAGGYMTIFWNTDYRASSINVLITLP
jgi:type II secretory pathway pseudopilin PulG